MRLYEKVRQGEFILTLLLMAFMFLVLEESIRLFGVPKDPHSAGLFPFIISVIGIAALALNLKSLLTTRVQNDGGTKRNESLAQRKEINKDLLVMIIMVIAYVLLIPVLHFIPATALFVLGATLYYKEVSKFNALLVTAGLIAFIELVFRLVFRIILP